MPLDLHSALTMDLPLDENLASRIEPHLASRKGLFSAESWAPTMGCRLVGSWASLMELHWVPTMGPNSAQSWALMMGLHLDESLASRMELFSAESWDQTMDPHSVLTLG